MGFRKSPRYKYMSEEVVPAQYDRNFSDMTVEEIVEALDAALSLFEGNLGNVHVSVPFIRLRELTAIEVTEHMTPSGLSAAEHRICELSLPAHFGLALNTEDQFKMLGLYDRVSMVKKPDRTNMFGGAAYGSVYMMGDDGAGASLFTGIIPLRKGTVGSRLLADRIAIKKKTASELTAKHLTLAPRLILVPTDLEWVIDLSSYEPSPAYKGTFHMFVLLHDALMQTALALFGLDPRPYDLEVGDGMLYPFINPSFEADKPCASFYVEVQFGSQELADVFGISGQAPFPLAWSTATAQADQNYITLLERDAFTEYALDRWAGNTEQVAGHIANAASPNERKTLNLHWGHITPNKTYYQEAGKRGDQLPYYLQSLRQKYADHVQLQEAAAAEAAAAAAAEGGEEAAAAEATGDQEEEAGEDEPPPPADVGTKPKTKPAAGGAAGEADVVQQAQDQEEAARRRQAAEQQEAERLRLLRKKEQEDRAEADRVRALQQQQLQQQQQQQQQQQLLQQQQQAAQDAANLLAQQQAAALLAQQQAADAAWQAELEPLPAPAQEDLIVRREPNLQPPPARTFAYFQPWETSRCAKAGTEAGTNFPKQFFLISEDGERRDFIANYGPSAVAGCFTADQKAGINVLDDSPLGEGFVLDNFTSGERTLKFFILKDDMTVFKNKQNYDAFVRTTLSVLKLSSTLHNPLF